MTQAKPRIRLYVAPALSGGSTIELTGNQAHYAGNVMRAHPGDAVLLFNGRDGEWLAAVEAVGKKHVSLRVKEQTKKQKPSPDLWLVFAPIKNKTEQVVEKAVELGVSRLMPAIMRHSVVKSVNMEKLAAHAMEAAEQCERLDVPPIEECSSFSHIIGAWPKDRVLLYADEGGSGESLKTLLPKLPQAPLALLIGPEGGFSKEEQAMLAGKSFVTSFGLGPRILRADTAAVAALACIQAWRGDWDEKPNFEARA